MDHIEYAETELLDPVSGDDESGMVAVFSDGSKAVLPDYTLRDIRAAKAVSEPVKTKGGTNFFTGQMDNATITVRKRSCKTGMVVALLQDGKQLAQLTGLGLAEQTTIDIMVDTAEKYCKKELESTQLKEYKEHAATAAGKTAAKKQPPTTEEGASSSTTLTSTTEEGAKRKAAKTSTDAKKQPSTPEEGAKKKAAKTSKTSSAKPLKRFIADEMADDDW